LERILPDTARFLKEIPRPVAAAGRGSHADGAPGRGYSPPRVGKSTMLAVHGSLVNIELLSINADKTVSGPGQFLGKITSQGQLFVAYLGTESRVM